ncbi:MAG TPA: alpha/beta hydrolase-fold protein [Flavisolibacter sp.]
MTTPILKHKRRSALLFIAALFITLSGIAQDDSSIAIAHRTELFSKILNEKRTVYVSTPGSMKKGETFPVIYLLDGEAFIEMAGGQVRYLSESYKITPSMIVVGIRNTDRTRDLTPTHYNLGPDGRPDTSASAFGRTSGGGENFLRFIKEELMPFVEARYPAGPYKILAGHSLGGLMAVYCMVNHPGYFNAYIAMSPSLQWDNEVMLKQAAEKLGNGTLAKRFFFCDANEGGAFHANQLKLDSLLRQKNANGLNYKYVYYPEETHTSEPVKALYDGLRHVYPEWHLTYNSAFRKVVNSQIIKEHYKKLSAIYGYEVTPLQEEIIQVSRFLRNDPKRIADAIDLLQTYIPRYPNALNMQELLGDIYVKAGEREKAKAVYQNLLKRSPDNAALQQKLKQLVP